MIFIIMGVAGSGKTTIGKLLAKKLGWQFLEGDEFHSKVNIEKMAQGIPLTDEDRAGWLSAIAERIQNLEGKSKSAVITCSALKKSYREKLAGNSKDIHFVYLRGSYETIYERLKARQGHYMKVALLKSQFEILEEPEDALVFDIKTPPREIAEVIAAKVSQG